jgi:hypothetical protein
MAMPRLNDILAKFLTQEGLALVARRPESALVNWCSRGLEPGSYSFLVTIRLRTGLSPPRCETRSQPRWATGARSTRVE